MKPFGLSFFRPARPNAPPPSVPVEALPMTERYAAVAAATSPDALDALWAAWEARGCSREGLLYAAVLERMAVLGCALSPDEQAAIALAERRRKHGKTLPLISGTFRR